MVKHLFDLKTPAKIFQALTTAAFISALSGCAATLTHDRQTQLQPAVQHLVIIGIDGLSPDGILNAETPTIDRLLSNGAHTFQARAVLPTSSSSNWKSMLSAAGPEQHGVTSNGWAADDFVLPPITTGLEPIFPTLFGEYRAQQPQANIAAVYTWQDFARLIERSALTYDQHGKDDQETTQLAADFFVKESPELLFVHLDDVDHAGHHEGHKTPGYYQAVANADSHVKTLLESIETAGLQESTLVILASDHGGIGYGHGGETLDEIQIPLILSGPMVKQHYTIEEFVYTYDIGATAAWALQITPNTSWIGQPITSAFKGFAAPEKNQTAPTVTNTLPKPKLLPDAELYQPPGKLFLDTPITVTMEATQNNTEIHYTLDGSPPTRLSPRYEAPFRLDESAVVTARQFGSDDTQSDLIRGYFYGVNTTSTAGIRFSYYEGENWHYLPVLDTLAPIKTGTSYHFRLDDIPNRPSQFALRFDSNLQISEGGDYTFYLASDDGSKLYIDGEEIVNNDGAHGVIERSGTVDLTPGYHKIRVDYFNEDGGHWLDVMVKPPNGFKRLIMPEHLFIKPESDKPLAKNL